MHNEELLLYLLQLVQALRYEEPEFLQGVSPSHAPTLSADGTYSEGDKIAVFHLSHFVSPLSHAHTD